MNLKTFEMVIDDDDLMPTGKYKGFLMKEVPDEYLLDLYRKINGRRRSADMDNVYDYICFNIDAIMLNLQRKTFNNLITEDQ